MTVKDDHFVPVPMEEVAGKTKFVDLTGIRYSVLRAIQSYESAHLEVREEQELWAKAAQVVNWLDCHSSLDTIRALAMRLGVPAQTVLSVLEELARLEESGENVAQAVAHCAVSPSPP